MESAIIYQTLIELRLLKIGIPYSEIQKMSKTEIDLYMGAYTALEEKQQADQEAANRAANLKSRTGRPVR